MHSGLESKKERVKKERVEVWRNVDGGKTLVREPVAFHGFWLANGADRETPTKPHPFIKRIQEDKMMGLNHSPNSPIAKDD